jgi:hypothetical protein
LGAGIAATIAIRRRKSRAQGASVLPEAEEMEGWRRFGNDGELISANLDAVFARRHDELTRDASLGSGMMASFFSSVSSFAFWRGGEAVTGRGALTVVPEAGVAGEVAVEEL